MFSGFMHAAVKHLATGFERQVPGGKDGQELLKFTPGDTGSGSDCKLTSTTSTEHVPKVTEAGEHKNYLTPLRSSQSILSLLKV